MDKWRFFLLSNVTMDVTGEQKDQIVSQLTNLLRNADIGVIEMTSEDGSAVGLRSDSIVCWVKILMPPPPSQIVPASGLPGNPFPANGS